MKNPMKETGLRPASPAGRRLMLVLVFTLLVPGAAARAEEGSAPSSSLEAFEKLYAEVEQAVADGRLPPSAGTAAEDHRFDLEKDLIRTDAEIEILKLEAARYEDARQDEALERLIAAAAARERRMCVAIRQLEGLAGMPADLSAVPTAAEAAAEEVVAEGEKKLKKGKFNVTFEAEDLVENPDS